MALVPIQIFFYICIYIIFTIDLAYIILSNVSLSTSSSLPVTLAIVALATLARATSTGTHVISDERLRFRSSAFPINIFLSEARLPASRSKHIPI